MKIAIATVQVPFVRGGAELHAENLKKALIEHGHEAEIVTMPFYDWPASNLEKSIIASRLTDINNSWGGHIDLCIGLKFPAYFMPHDNKVIWALHQYRASYDLFDTEYSGWKNDYEGNSVRDIVTRSDNLYLKEAKRIYSNSLNVANRMKKYNGISPIPLYHPCPNMEKFYCGENEDYILMPSRINITKRQELAIAAISESHSNIKLLIVGAADNQGDLKKLQDLIKERRLTNRVKFLGFVPLEEKIRLYANARGVLFIPFDEDYGYITLEAMAACKPLITCTDSGGPLEFVINNKTGFVCSPSPRELASVIDTLAYDPAMAVAMGLNAKKHLVEMDVSWDHVVKELLK